MTANESADLSHLTLAASQKLVGQDFVRPNADGPDVLLRLEAAEHARRDPTVDNKTDRPFSLIFSGPVDRQLTQGMHDLENPVQSLRGVFLVPLGDDGAGPKYEAVFA